MREIDQLPPQTEAEREACADCKEVSDGFLRLFELEHTTIADVIDGLKSIGRPLMDVEVYWLGTVDPPPQDIAGKVCDSLQRGFCTSAEALKYFARAFPNLASSTPSDGVESWWTEQIRSLPRVSLASYQQSTRTDSSEGSGECEVHEREDDDEDAAPNRGRR